MRFAFSIQPCSFESRYSSAPLYSPTRSGQSPLRENRPHARPGHSSGYSEKVHADNDSMPMMQPATHTDRAYGRALRSVIQRIFFHQFHSIAQIAEHVSLRNALSICAAYALKRPFSEDITRAASSTIFSRSDKGTTDA